MSISNPEPEDDDEPEELAPEIDAHGQPVNQEITPQALSEGLEVHGDTPEEARKESHPTPNRPSGRLEP